MMIVHKQMSLLCPKDSIKASHSVHALNNNAAFTGRRISHLDSMDHRYDDDDTVQDLDTAPAPSKV